MSYCELGRRWVGGWVGGRREVFIQQQEMARLPSKQENSLGEVGGWVGG